MMPHSKRPRRNRVAKKRARLGLPPLPPLGEGEPIELAAQPSVGTACLMVPIATHVRGLLRAVRREQQRRDPQTVASDQLYAAAILTAALVQVHAALFPSLIAAPTAQDVAQMHKMNKVLGRPFNG